MTGHTASARHAGVVRGRRMLARLEHGDAYSEAW